MVASSHSDSLPCCMAVLHQNTHQEMACDSPCQEASNKMNALKQPHISTQHCIYPPNTHTTTHIHPTLTPPHISTQHSHHHTYPPSTHTTTHIHPTLTPPHISTQHCTHTTHIHPTLTPPHISTQHSHHHTYPPNTHTTTHIHPTLTPPHISTQHSHHHTYPPNTASHHTYPPNTHTTTHIHPTLHSHSHPALTSLLTENCSWNPLIVFPDLVLERELMEILRFVTLIPVSPQVMYSSRASWMNTYWS